ncbi:LysR family transcriptional regulator [Nocardia farcinica]|uniref:LysR family transcriptional regulator n=1 Tax=Nocardia farcinica TaxID=37329 RepID=UPI000BFA360D|nr:LysR family transcriptional regulator [Nocardia farcinica]MBF6068438.1 LysR family transcriptional regulator [Nocardia farcinica]MBF6442359.1 LysR family transcriptional regulator [Nocardia farcinica]
MYVEDLDLGAVRAFAAVAEYGQFTLAAAELGISQQAVSKRIARLENQLGVALFERVRSGADPTPAGRRLLSHARDLLVRADEAVAAVRDDPGPLRVAVLGERQAAMRAMRFFLEQQPDCDAEIVLSHTEIMRSGGAVTSRDALLAGRVHAVFARAGGGPRPLPARVAAAPAYLEPLHLLVGKDHPLAGRAAIALSELRGTVIWVPGVRFPSEWADYYRELAEFAGFTIDSRRRPEPDRLASANTSTNIELIVSRVAASATLMTFSGEGFETPWHPNIRRVPVVDPVPAYPHALLWDATDTHPGLPDLIAHVRANYNAEIATGCWAPAADRALFGVRD